MNSESNENPGIGEAVGDSFASRLAVLEGICTVNNWIRTFAEKYDRPMMDFIVGTEEERSKVKWPIVPHQEMKLFFKVVQFQTRLLKSEGINVFEQQTVPPRTLNSNIVVRKCPPHAEPPSPSDAVLKELEEIAIAIEKQSKIAAG